MISLFITLFMCLFSICPSNYKIEDQLENNNYFESNQQLSEKREMDYINNRGYIYRYYNVYEILNVYNFHNYYAASPEFFDNPRQYSAINYHLSDTAYLYSNYASVDFASQDFPQESLSPIAFDTITLTVDFIATSGNGFDYASLNVSFYYIKGVNQGAVFNLGGFNYYFNYLNADNPSGMWNYYDSTYNTHRGYIVSIMTSQRTINEFYDLWRGDYAGYNEGYQIGYTTGESAGYQQGYTAALSDFEDVDNTAFTIFSGILDVGLLPVNVFLAILNFDVFGINISGFVSALLTISIVIIIVRFLFGGKNNDK